jgi:hypothetical protein
MIPAEREVKVVGPYATSWSMPQYSLAGEIVVSELSQAHVFQKIYTQ